jgi:hypothetical protein
MTGLNGSERFVEAFQEEASGYAGSINLQPGDHGFDGEAMLETGSLREDMAIIGEHWLG